MCSRPTIVFSNTMNFTLKGMHYWENVCKFMTNFYKILHFLWIKITRTCEIVSLLKGQYRHDQQGMEPEC